MTVLLAEVVTKETTIGRTSNFSCHCITAKQITQDLTNAIVMKFGKDEWNESITKCLIKICQRLCLVKYFVLLIFGGNWFRFYFLCEQNLEFCFLTVGIVSSVYSTVYIYKFWELNLIIYLSQWYYVSLLHSPRRYWLQWCCTHQNLLCIGCIFRSLCLKQEH